MNKKLLLILGPVLLLLHLIIFSPLLSEQEFIQLDTGAVIDPLASIDSLSGYMQARKEGKIYDIAPIRDFSHWIDIQFIKLIGKEVGHIVNYLYFWVFYFCFFIFIRKLFNIKVAVIATTLLAFHPTLANVALIVTWRKHIISSIFALVFLILTLHRDLDKTRNKVKLATVHFLGLLSVPIHILLPIWTLIYDYLTNKPNVIQLLKRHWANFVISLVVGLANIYYYATSYVELSGVQKYFDGNMGDRLLAVGRAFVQVILPYNHALFYSRGSIENLLGISLLGITMYLSFKFLERKFFFLSWFLFLANLIVLNLKTTTIFLFDSYLIIPIVAIFIIGIEMISKHWKAHFKIPLLILFLFFSYRSFSVIRDRVGLLNAAKNNFEAEPSCPGTQFYLSRMILLKQFEHMEKVGQHYINTNCRWSHKGNESLRFRILSYLLYLNKKLTSAEKIKIVLSRDSKNKGDLDLLLLTLLYFENGESEKSDHSLSQLIEIYKKGNMKLGNLYEPLFVDRIIEECKKYQSKYCKIFLKEVSSKP